MRVAALFLTGLLVFLAGAGQIKPAGPPPVDLPVLREGLENPDLVEIPTLIDTIESQGIAFDLGEAQLGAIMASSRKGNRDPNQVARLIAACLNVCEKCRAREIAQLSKEDLIKLMKLGFSPASVLQEARVRGVKGIEISEPAVKELRAAGASDELIKFLMPDDRIPTIPLSGYQTLPLKHAEEYDPAAAKGWIKMEAKLPAGSQNEFVFVHTGLFVKAVKGDVPTDVSAYFNKPAPRNVKLDFLDEDAKFDDLDASAPVVDDKKNANKGKQKAPPAPPFILGYSEPYDDGQNALIFTLTNSGTAVEHVAFTLRWEVRTSPKTKEEPKPAQNTRDKKK